MSKTLLVTGLILLFLAVEGARMWYARHAGEQAAMNVQAKSQAHIDSLASAKIDERAAGLSGEWHAQLEQEKQLQQTLKDSIALLKSELAAARYGNLSELVEKLGEAGIRKQEKNQVLSLKKMDTAPWAGLRLFLDESIPGQTVTVKITRPLKNTESVTWRTGEVYYLKDSEDENLLEVYLVRNTAQQAMLQWRYYSGFGK